MAWLSLRGAQAAIRRTTRASTQNLGSGEIPGALLFKKIIENL
jgi:hypothetical protein